MKKTKEEFKELVKSESKHYDLGAERNAFLDGVYFVLRQEYSDQEKQGWVKIASPETMPPYFEHVIVFGGEVHCRLFSKAWVALPPEEFVERTGISHWMRLPKKPEV